MGLFDIGIRKEIESKKNTETLNLLKQKISNDSKETATFDKDKLLLNKFSPTGVFLKFNLEAQVVPDGKKSILVIDGELQQVLLLVILIVISILFTYGFGVILVIGFTYFQKHLATKYLNHIIDELKE